MSARRCAALLAVLALAAAAPAQAQFRLDLNRLIDTAKNVGKATGEIVEKEEIEIGSDRRRAQQARPRSLPTGPCSAT